MPESKEETVPGYMETAAHTVAKRRHELEHHDGFDDRSWDALPSGARSVKTAEAREDIESAEPAIRRDEREKLEARLLSYEASEDAAAWLDVQPPVTRSSLEESFDLVRGILRAALKATKEKGRTDD